MRALVIDAVTALYALSLATAAVMLTFVAIDDGLSLGVIAALSAASAATQFVSRALVNGLFRLTSDRVVMAGSLLVLCASMVSVLVVPGIAGLLVAQLLQGISRAGFWSGSQVHVLRKGPRPARRMARNQFISNGLAVLGPVIAGVMAGDDPRGAAVVIVAITVAGALLCTFLTRLPVFARVKKSPENGIWQYPGMRVGAFGTLAAGAFNAVLNTFVPIVFGEAGWTETHTGVLIGVVNAGLLVGSLASGFVGERWFAPAVTTATLSVGLGAASMVCVPFAAWVSAGGSVLAGIGSGVILTLGPTLVGSSVPSELRGSAVVFAGVFRAGALFATPLMVSAAALVLPMPLVMLAVGVLSSAPGLVSALPRRRE
ncbi:MAG: MFS transporter [Microbacterium sp.]